MKLIRHYELEMTDKELRAFRELPREGGLAKALTDMIFGRIVAEDEDYEETNTEDYEGGCEETNE